MKYYLCTTLTINIDKSQRYNNFVTNNIVNYILNNPDKALINTCEITKAGFDKWNNRTD